MPAAYYENLNARPVEQWPDYLNLQGVSNFDDNDPLYYAMEHCLEPRVKQHRWVNDTSVNLQYYSAQDAALALQALTDPTVSTPPHRILSWAPSAADRRTDGRSFFGLLKYFHQGLSLTFSSSGR